jgi:hypothetical protein
MSCKSKLIRSIHTCIRDRNSQENSGGASNQDEQGYPAILGKILASIFRNFTLIR